MIAWDDYRLLLAIHRSKGLPGAAKTLSVTLSTVLRRLERVERQLGTRVFERNKGKYQPTQTGFELLEVAEGMEQQVLVAERYITGKDRNLRGELRITATEALSIHFLAHHISRFNKKYPDIKIKIISDDHILSLSSREADIALRPRRPEEVSLIARKVFAINWGIYIHKDHAEKYNKISELSDLSGQSFVCWSNSIVSSWISKNIPNVNLPVSTTNLVASAAIASSSELLVVLPKMVGIQWPNLASVLSPVSDLLGELWLTTHEDIRKNAKIRVFFDFLKEAGELDKE
nr:LysR family transcriptional regulator [uncultured Vibrio sp.]